MNEIYVARKAFGQNAAAFITLNTENKKVSVHGKFYDGFRAHCGPEVNDVAPVPENLLAEIEKRGTWRADKSPELEAFCNEIWLKAKQKETWFNY